MTRLTVGAEMGTPYFMVEGVGWHFYVQEFIECCGMAIVFDPAGAWDGPSADDVAKSIHDVLSNPGRYDWVDGEDSVGAAGIVLRLLSRCKIIMTDALGGEDQDMVCPWLVAQKGDWEQIGKIIQNRNSGNYITLYELNRPECSTAEDEEEALSLNLSKQGRT